MVVRRPKTGGERSGVRKINLSKNERGWDRGGRSNISRPVTEYTDENQVLGETGFPRVPRRQVFQSLQPLFRFSAG